MMKLLAMRIIAYEITTRYAGDIDYKKEQSVGRDCSFLYLLY